MHMTDAEAATELDGVGETLAYARRLVESIDAAAAALQIASVGRELRQPVRNFGLHTRLDHAVDAIERVVDELRRRVPEGDA
jgi:chemotaxis regulatin CheY-phosphate phosphatase CheZ